MCVFSLSDESKCTLLDRSTRTLAAVLTAVRHIVTLAEAVSNDMSQQESCVSSSSPGERGATAASEPELPVPATDQPPGDAAAPASSAEASLPQRRDLIDVLLALFDRAGSIVPALLALPLGAAVAYLGAICVTTALLRRSAAAQEFFVNLLADMLWSGYSILIVIGVGIALFSLVQLLLWPRGWVWRWIARRLGAPLAWATTVCWSATVLVEAFLIGWGFELWAWPFFIELKARSGLAPTPDGLLIVSVLAAPLIALLPEWCARFGFTQLFRAWRELRST